jgi:hypothetical protein
MEDGEYCRGGAGMFFVPTQGKHRFRGDTHEEAVTVLSFLRNIRRISSGTVSVTWKYPQGRISACLASSHFLVWSA